MCFRKLIEEEVKIKYKFTVEEEDKEAVGFSLMGELNDYFGRSYNTNICIVMNNSLLDDNQINLIYSFFLEKGEVELSTYVSRNKKDVIKKLKLEREDLTRILQNEANIQIDSNLFEQLAYGAIIKKWKI